MTMTEDVKVSAIDTATGHRLATVKEACRYGKFSHTKCYELINAGRIKAKKFDARTLIDLDSIDAMYAALPDLVPNPGAKS
ncbi:helix-turn-helix domain-containing protein [Bradyrhizobium diazoefficiens]|uniref:helix-turn-helix domain-containing protein n=1 Tax=Bradyrhizobium TaxID=374 RepID=UPI0004B4029C|nr:MULTISPECIES: helix-turn-helix domain-containing protein [Bradyrhizobium]WLA75082.1 helix-turn-helix domain-containing protein [Bradyrhizobium diazoefficiens]